MGVEAAEILAETGDYEESCVVDITQPIKTFYVSVHIAEEDQDERLDGFKVFLSQLVHELQSDDAEMVVYPTAQSTSEIVSIIEKQVLMKYKLVFAWSCEVAIIDEAKMELAMEFHLQLYTHQTPYGYTVQ